jgi:branched chain amino acid efflux pump
MTIPTVTLWLVILLLGLGTYLIRLSFLGLIGNRVLPGWVLRHLRYAPFAVIPGLVLPMLVPGGEARPEPLRLGIAALVLLVGWRSKTTLAGLAIGALGYFGLKLAGVG